MGIWLRKHPLRYIDIKEKRIGGYGVIDNLLLEKGFKFVEDNERVIKTVNFGYQ